MFWKNVLSLRSGNTLEDEDLAMLLRLMSGWEANAKLRLRSAWGRGCLCQWVVVSLVVHPTDYGLIENYWGYSPPMLRTTQQGSLMLGAVFGEK